MLVVTVFFLLKGHKILEIYTASHALQKTLSPLASMQQMYQLRYRQNQKSNIQIEIYSLYNITP